MYIATVVACNYYDVKGPRFLDPGRDVIYGDAMRYLTSRERLLRCFRHQEMDRPGVFVRWTGMEENVDPSYAEMKRFTVENADLKVPWYARSLVEPPAGRSGLEPYDERYDIKVSVLTTPGGELVQRELVGRQGQPGYCKEHFIKTCDDAERYLSLPEPAIRGDCASFHEAVERIVDRGIVDAELITNPAGAVVDLMGSERFALMCMDDRDLVHRLIEHECRLQCRLARHLVDRGVGPCFSFCGQEYIVPPIHGREDFFEFCVAYDRRVTDILRSAGGRVHVHCHGSIATVLDGFIELGADVIHPFEAPPMGNVTPRQAKGALRGRVALEGNIQIADMYQQGPGQIREQVRALVRDAFDDSTGLIVCATASPWRAGDGALCTANYRSMVEEVIAGPGR
jgi:hypothetical protein